MRETRLGFVSFAAWALAIVTGGCGGATAPTGGCSMDSAVVCPGNFVGWSCSGSDRPDEVGNANKAVAGFLCASTGETLANGKAPYCCTSNITMCAVDPNAICPSQCNDPTIPCVASLTGYSCMGTNRPDAYFQADGGLGGVLAFNCQQGVKGYGLIQYCCGTAPIPSCMRNTNVPCVKGTLGFSCASSSLPSETDLGMNQSRSEVPLICSLSAPSTTPGYVQDYCCYTPTAVPPGATCLQDQLQGQSGVPGCEAGISFGYACTGKDDTPDQDYPRMACAHGSALGLNSLGVGSTLYCCDFHQ
jgi:hypothetical protein